MLWSRCLGSSMTFLSRVPGILDIIGWSLLQNCVWGWKSEKWERRQTKTMWKVLSRKSRKGNSYDTTLNFFLNYLFLPVDTFITVWSEWFLWFMFPFQVRNKSICCYSSGCCAHAVEFTLWSLWIPHIFICLCVANGHFIQITFWPLIQILGSSVYDSVC